MSTSVYPVQVAVTDKLFNIDTGSYEVGKINTEYLSPDQKGGIYGDIFRRVYLIDDMSAGAERFYPSGFTLTGDIVGIELVAKIRGDYYGQVPAVDYGSTARNIELTYQIAGNSVRVHAGSQSTIASGSFVILDYTK